MKLRTAVAAVCCMLLFSACGNYGGEIIIPEPEIIVTDEEAIRPSSYVPVIMPEKDDEKYSEYADIIGEEQCIPGYVYLYQERNLDPEKSRLLLLVEERVDREIGLYQEYFSSTEKRYVYCVSEDKKRLIAADKVSGQTTDVYTCTENVIEMFTNSSSHQSKGAVPGTEYIFFKDGGRLVFVDSTAAQAQVVESENGISDINAGKTFAKEREQLGVRSPYYCEECDITGVLWADGSGQYYWYHPHLGENQPVDYTDLYDPLYLHKDFCWRFKVTGGEAEYMTDNDNDEFFSYTDMWCFEEENFEKAELYLRDKETGETTLLLDNAAYGWEDMQKNIFALVKGGEGDKLVKVDVGTGRSSDAYISESGSLEYSANSYDDEVTYYVLRDKNSFVLFSDSEDGVIKTLSFDENDKVRDFEYTNRDMILQVNDELFTLRISSLNTYSLFPVPDGISEVRAKPYGSLYNRDPAELSYSEYFPEEDLSDAYYCDACDRYNEYFLWEDEKGNWSWFHFHSREQTPVIIVVKHDVLSDGQLQDIEYVREKE